VPQENLLAENCQLLITTPPKGPCSVVNGWSVMRPSSKAPSSTSFSPALLKGVGINVLIYPVKGVSITVTAAPWNGAPTHAILDDGRMFGLIQIGDRLRVAGSAEIAGFDATPMPARVQAIIDKVLQTFPQFARCFAGHGQSLGRIAAGESERSRLHGAHEHS
jgi:hypothetical protein